MVVQNCLRMRVKCGNKRGSAGDTAVGSDSDLLRGREMSLNVGRVRNFGEHLVHHGKAVAGSFSDEAPNQKDWRGTTGKPAREFTLLVGDSSLLREYDSKTTNRPVFCKNRAVSPKDGKNECL